MPDHTLNTPGVFIPEVNATPHSVAPVATAIPAFVGYTPKITEHGVSYLNKAHKVSSFREFNEIYGVPKKDGHTILPSYYLREEEEEPLDGNFVQIGLSFHHMLPDPNTQYYLYQSVKMFFENGGNDAYIVSIGTYGVPTQDRKEIWKTHVNSNVVLDELLDGIALLKSEMEPTMYICPEATLLSEAENSTLMKAMLLQQSQIERGICIFDIIGSKNPDPILYGKAVTTFRENTGNIGCSFGTAYYPFISTTLVQNGDLIFKNFFGGALKELNHLLRLDLGVGGTLDSVMADIKDPLSASTDSDKNIALLGVSPLYRELVTLATTISNLLPPSGAMAGVMASVDAADGVWNAPANVSIVGVSSLPIDLTNAQQNSFNVDAVTGKSINVIRKFTGRGIVVWGARTLDGNSMDWKYIPVRRTMTFIEQSCKLATQAYTFEPNVVSTWSAVKAMISNFLNDLWRQGALQGAMASDAYSVMCGLGSTMTSQDIIEGNMKVSVLVALIHPAEFSVLEFTQVMSSSS